MAKDDEIKLLKNTVKAQAKMILNYRIGNQECIALIEKWKIELRAIKSQRK